MRAVFALLAALLCATGARADDMPFLPLPNTTDHVVTMEVVNAGPGQARGGLRRIAHAGAWTRVDGHRNGRFVPFSYIGHAASVLVTVLSPQIAGVPMRLLRIQRGPEAAMNPGWDRKPAKTGERRVANGELCEIWNVARNVPLGLTRLGCLTEDGIEVSVRVLNREGSEVFYAKAMSVERRAVRHDEVQPPAGLLDLGSWVGQAQMSSPDPTGASPSTASHEAVMRTAPGGPGGARTRRRHGAWTYRETLDAARRRSLLIMNEPAGFVLFLDGQRPGGIETLALWLQPRPEPPGGPMARQGRVLGEICSYFAPARGASGVDHAECRTQDGVVLREERFPFGDREDGAFVAVRVRRGGVPLASVLPPADLLAPARWGLPR